MCDIALIQAATVNRATKNVIRNVFVFRTKLTGVIQAKMKSGADESPKSHLQPKLGATANARATSKQAPSAQKHYRITGHVKFFRLQ